MGVLENGKYKEFERVSFDELRKTLVYISIAEHLGIFNKCETEYVYCDGKYILRVSQDVNPKDELFTLNDIKSGFNSYLESVNKESESSDDEYVEVKKKNDDDEETEEVSKIERVADISKLFQRLYKYKQINYDTRARICRRIYEMAALDFVLAHSSRKPEDYVLRRSNEGSYRLLNPGNNGSIFGKAPGFTVYTTTNEKTGQPIYSASRNKGKPLSYELFITDRVKNMKYNYDFTFGETLHKVLNNLRVKDFIDILTVDFQECGRFNRLYTHGEIFELSDQFKKHRELIRQNQHYFDA